MNGMFFLQARGATVLNSRLRIGLFGLVLLGGYAGPAADLMDHHISSTEKADVRHEHVELPGSCHEHGHRCNLGVPLTGPKLLASTLTAPTHEAPTHTAVAPAGRLAGDDEMSLRFPRTRAPPPLA